MYKTRDDVRPISQAPATLTALRKTVGVGILASDITPLAINDTQHASLWCRRRQQAHYHSYRPREDGMPSKWRYFIISNASDALNADMSLNIANEKAR